PGGDRRLDRAAPPRRDRGRAGPRFGARRAHLQRGPPGGARPRGGGGGPGGGPGGPGGRPPPPAPWGGPWPRPLAWARRHRAAAAVGQRRVALRRQLVAGFAVIAARRPLLRVTVTSVVSYAGIGMLLVCCPLLGAQRLGDPARGALLISAIAVASLTANVILSR